MKLIKKINIIFLCLFFMLAPAFSVSNFSYADDNTEVWTYLGFMPYEDARNYFVGAFKAYASTQRKYFNFSYNIDKAIVSYGYNKLSAVAKSAGYSNLRDYLDSIAYTKMNGIQKFFYTDSGLRLMKDLLDEILDEYGIGNNDLSNTRIYSNEWLQDNDGNGAYVFQCDSISVYDNPSLISKYGTAYIDSNIYMPIYNNLNNNSGTQITRSFSNSGNKIIYFNKRNDTFFGNECLFFNDRLSVNNQNAPAGCIYVPTQTANTESYISFIHSGNYLYMCSYFNGTFLDNHGISTDRLQISPMILLSIQDLIPQQVDLESDGEPDFNWQPYRNGIISIEQGIKDIKELLENSTPNVTAEGTNTDDDKPPTIPVVPIGGSANIGGSVNPNGDFEFKMPELGDLDPDPQSLPENFKIPNLIRKFPFCLPYDLYNLLNLLDTEPQAPRFQATITLPLFNYTLDYNLSYFDGVMVYVRNFMLALYVIGLIFITKNLIF